MRGLEWRPRTRGTASDSYDARVIDAEVDALRVDPAVTKGEGDLRVPAGGQEGPNSCWRSDCSTKLRNGLPTAKQTQKANADQVFELPAMRNLVTTPTSQRIYAQDEMDADHVTAWSKGGNTDLANCQMLCVPHNRAKGNR